MSLIGVEAASGGQSDDLLDECIAGINANLALIEHGTATYRQKIFAPLMGSEKPRERTVEVIFDYPRCSFKLSERRLVGGKPATVTECTTVDGDHRIQYWPGIGGSRIPNANVVMILPNVPDRRVLMDPRHQRHGQWADPPSFTYEIARMRSASAAGLNADGLIEIATQNSADGKRGVYWLSPEQGYALVRAREWAPAWDGDEPTNTYEAKLRQVSNGAFVVSYRHERNCGVENGVLTPWLEDEWRLDTIDLVSRPAEKSFTLEGLDLPIGAPIHDRMRGREYRYGVGAVDVMTVEVGQPSGPMRLRSWLGWFNAAVAAALLIWLGNRIARWYDRIRSRSRGSAFLNT